MDHGSLLLSRYELTGEGFWNFELCGVTKDRLLHHRMFGSWLSDSRLGSYIQRTLVPPIGDAVRSQTSNGVWDAVGSSHEHPPPDQRKRAEGTTPTRCSALFCCSFRGHWLHLCASFANEACFHRKLILLWSPKLTPLWVGFFYVLSVWRMRR